MLPLFDNPKIAGRPKKEFASRLRQLAGESLYLGTSSWKYPGWLGSVYSEDRYSGRRGFSQKAFERGCLSEYAEVFPIVGGDFSFYRFYETPFWDRLFSQVPDGFQFLLKVPQEITVRSWPQLARHGALAGRRNPSFLDADLFRTQFTDPLQPHRDKIGVVMFEFGAARYRNGIRDFVQDLAPFLDALPNGFRYGAEIRNEEFLDPTYFDCLRSHGVAHIFNSWTKMPPLPAQLQIAEAFTADFSVCRALLRPGRTYEQAVAGFQPYEQVQETYPEARDALAEFLRQARLDRRSAFTVINNRFEGNAPGTIGAVVDAL